MRFAALCLTVLLAFAAAVPVSAQPNTDPCRPGDRPCWEAHITHQRNVNAWWAEVIRRQKWERDMARLARHLANRRTGYGYVEGVKVCGGPGYVTCPIVQRESRFNPRARNPRSSAGGLYQLLRFWLPWCGLGGYSNAAEVPVPQQVECSRRIVARYGLGPWRL